MKICVITGSRSEFDLLKNLIIEIKKDNFFDLKLFVTGAHLSKYFGETIKYIKKNKLKIDKIIDVGIKNDDISSISNSFSIGIKKFSYIFNKINPDAILILGDRYEIFSCAISACLNRIPIIHIHGGERTEGLIDEGIRHSITKLSHLHFVSTNEYKKRVIQLGESKNRVHNVGSLGVEAIKKTKLMSKKELQEELNIIFKGKVALVSYHPETLEKSKNTKNFDNFLNSLKKLRNFTFIFTMPNADLGYKYIVNKFKKFVKKNHNSIFVKSLGHRKYFSLCKYSDIVIGNSSSGIIEIPSFKKPTLNVGSRQDGRLKSGSIIDCSHNTNEILKKVTLAFSKKFYKKIKKIKNPYFNGNTSKKIKNIIKKTNFKNLIFKKFIDIKY